MPNSSLLVMMDRIVIKEFWHRPPQDMATSRLAVIKPPGFSPPSKEWWASGASKVSLEWTPSFRSCFGAGNVRGLKVFCLEEFDQSLHLVSGACVSCGFVTV
jgi:hypothetical protein